MSPSNHPIPQGCSPVLADLIALDRAARQLVGPGAGRGQRLGGHLSSQRGRGLEFAEVRAYSGGDDVRHIDWRVTARTGQAHTRLYQEERERPTLIVLDLRRPMAFGSCNAFKSVIAAHAAALIGWAALQQGDRVGAMILDDRLTLIPPRRHRRQVLQMLEKSCHPRLDVPVQASLHEALRELQRIAPTGSVCYLISDFIDLDHAANAQLNQLAQHRELVLCPVSDPLERALPAGAWPLHNEQGHYQLHLHSLDQQQQYQQRFRQQQQHLQDLARQWRARWHPLSTDQSPLLALLDRPGGARA